MLNCQKHLFDLEENKTYINCAFMSPLLNKVANAGIEAVKIKQRPYQISGSDFFTGLEKLKSTFAQLVDIDDAQRIAPIPSVSYGIANAALNIPFEKGDKIILLEDQFPSNVYPWMNICAKKGTVITTVKRPKDDKIDWTDLIIKAMDSSTKCVAMMHVHWADGYLFDLKKIRAKCDKIGAYLIIDGTQSIGALPFSVAEIRPDALIVAAYKWMMGPYAFGFAYYSDKFDNGMPIEQNWITRKDSDDFANLVNYKDEYRPKAFRYSMGEMSNIISIPMVQKALDQLLEWTPEAIQEYVGEITKNVLPEFKKLGYKITPRSGKHLFGLEIPKGVSADSIKDKLAKASIFVSFRGNSIRIAPHVYNTEEDMQKLLQVLS